MTLFASVRTTVGAAVALRAGLLIYGTLQDQWSPMKYTDIDYFVFTDAATFVSKGQSPYDRDTYRYTPLLAWLVYPTVWRGLWFLFGKVMFAAGDIVAGLLIHRMLRSSGMEPSRSLKFASIWLLNPMVAQISTRGSSEGLVCMVVMALLWAVMSRRLKLAGGLLGIAVHFKIYPFIYAASIIWHLDETPKRRPGSAKDRARPDALTQLFAFVNPARIEIAVGSLGTFLALNVLMLIKCGWPFVEHSFLYHLTRTDHRHNFSPYNMMLYQNSVPGLVRWNLASLAFIPQIALSLVVIPLVLAKRSLPIAMLAQTFCFVTFNKVCTSQYFLWYLVFLPLYLPSSSMLQRPARGAAALVAWIAGQAFWLYEGYRLEFLGISTYAPELWSASAVFFLINVWILGIVIEDGAAAGPAASAAPAAPATKKHK